MKETVPYIFKNHTHVCVTLNYACFNIGFCFIPPTKITLAIYCCCVVTLKKFPLRVNHKHNCFSDFQFCESGHIT